MPRSFFKNLLNIFIILLLTSLACSSLAAPAAAETRYRYDSLPNAGDDNKTVAEFNAISQWGKTNIAYYFMNGTERISGDTEQDLVRAAHQIEDGVDVPGRVQRSIEEEFVGIRAAREPIGAAAPGERVRAGTAVQRVVSGETFQYVCAGVAGDHIDGDIAATVDIGAASQGQVLEIGRQGECPCALHGVRALAGQFDQHVVRNVGLEG